MFEAEVQKNPDNAVAWEKLGLSQAENENDKNAIPALQKSVELDPSRLDAWIALSVSYANEICRPEAFQGSFSILY